MDRKRQIIYNEQFINNASTALSSLPFMHFFPIVSNFGDFNRRSGRPGVRRAADLTYDKRLCTANFSNYLMLKKIFYSQKSNLSPKRIYILSKKVGNRHYLMIGSLCRVRRGSSSTVIFVRGKYFVFMTSIYHGFSNRMNPIFLVSAM